MMNPLFIPADAIGEFISIAFVVIAFISWIIRLVGQSREEAEAKARVQRAKRPAARVGTQGPPPRTSAQSEIDAFLRGTSSTTTRDADAEEIEIEIIPDEELRERSPAAQRQDQGRSQPIPKQGAGARSDWDQKFQQRREQLRSGVAERHLETSPLGEELRRHVEQTMAETELVQNQRARAEKELAEAQGQIQMLRDNAAASGPAVPNAARPGDLAALLRNPQSVKDAIVINEILSRPRALGRGTR